MNVNKQEILTIDFQENERKVDRKSWKRVYFYIYSRK